MTTSAEQTPDLDSVITLAVIELLLNPEYGFDWIHDLAAAEGVDLTEGQTTQVDAGIQRILDNLAIPFVQSLPEGAGREVYEEHLRKRAEAA